MLSKVQVPFDLRHGGNKKLKKTFATLTALALILIMSTAAQAYVETIDINSGYQFVTVDWTHTYDGSVPTPLRANLSILADDVDNGEIDKVFINGNYIGDLNFYGGFANNRPNGAGEYTSLTTFDVTPFLAAVMNIHVEVFNGASSYAVEILTSSLEVTAVPIPAAVWLLGTALLGIVGMRRKQA